nr:immunoglobulin light chain junction region [Macaca mulatta]
DYYCQSFGGGNYLLF